MSCRAGGSMRDFSAGLPAESPFPVGGDVRMFPFGEKV